MPKMRLDQYVYSLQPGYREPDIRKAFSHAVPLQTIVVYCYDPRAVGIPAALAKAWPDEVYPGELVLDAAGNKVGSQATIFPVVVAGGRAIDALRSIAIGQHLFGVRNIVIAHHTFCGTTSFTAAGITEAFQAEQGADISSVYDQESLAIPHFETSLAHDVNLVRQTKGIPQTVNIFGYLFNIDTDEFTPVVEDRAATPKISRS
jgi:carbonic anhydrase